MELRLNLESDTVEETHASPPVCVAPETLVRDVLKLLKDDKTGGALVLEKGKLVGIFTERDALKLMAGGGRIDVPIKDIMITDPVALKTGETVASAIRKMSHGGYRRLPIVDGAGKPAGTVKASSILRYLVEHFPQSVYNLPPAPDNVNKDREGA
jgi:CBS domain-containing protein